MKSNLVIIVFCFAALVATSQAQDVPKNIQEALISLDKQWGEAGRDSAKLDKLSATTC
jgi:hypothetical protein